VLERERSRRRPDVNNLRLAILTLEQPLTSTLTEASTQFKRSMFVRIAALVQRDARTLFSSWGSLNRPEFPGDPSASSTASSPTRNASLRELPLSDMVSWNTVTHWSTSEASIESSSCAATSVLVLCTCTRSRRADLSSHPSLDRIGRWRQG